MALLSRKPPLQAERLSGGSVSLKERVYQMPNFDVTVTETLVKNFMLTAENEKEAKKLAKKRYNDGVFVLDYEDLSQVNINIRG